MEKTARAGDVVKVIGNNCRLKGKVGMIETVPSLLKFEFCPNRAKTYYKFSAFYSEYSDWEIVKSDDIVLVKESDLHIGDKIKLYDSKRFSEEFGVITDIFMRSEDNICCKCKFGTEFIYVSEFEICKADK